MLFLATSELNLLKVSTKYFTVVCHRSIIVRVAVVVHDVLICI